jgi:hypothetical protein
MLLPDTAPLRARRLGALGAILMAAGACIRVASDRSPGGLLFAAGTAILAAAAVARAARRQP